MSILYKILVGVVLVLFILLYFVIKYHDDYQLHMIMGPKGAGKTTYLTKVAFKYLKKGRPVYSSVWIPGTYFIKTSDIGKYEFPKESVLLVDEVGIAYDNRKFSQLEDEVRDYYKLQRHYKNTVFLCSQVWDCDSKIRSLTDKLHILKKVANCMTFDKTYKPDLKVIRATNQKEASVSIDIVPMPGFNVIWLPKYHKYFDSFEAPRLRKKEWKLVPFPEGVNPPPMNAKEYWRDFKLSIIRYSGKVFSAAESLRSGLVRKVRALFHKSTDN